MKRVGAPVVASPGRLPGRVSVSALYSEELLCTILCIQELQIYLRAAKSMFDILLAVGRVNEQS